MWYEYAFGIIMLVIVLGYVGVIIVNRRKK